MSTLPSIYEYYSENGITTGLKTTPNEFLLNNKPITLYSGALHYFRVHPSYWRDRLRKLRAANLNCVETYFCWNLHNPEPDVYDFGSGGSDFEAFLNIEEFLKIAREEDLLVIARPGPYICAEWDFGGLPSWLLQDPEIKLRTSDEKYMKYVDRYFAKLLQILAEYQFTRNGPIIAFQIENEYGNVKEKDKPIDTKYLELLRDLYKRNDIVELLFTSDTPSNGNSGSIPDVLYTANFQDDPEKEFRILKTYQPDQPLMVMEYWTGWFDHWTEKHHTRSNEAFSDVFNRILTYPASVNMYMFHGGTNWGFLNGANLQISTTDNSSYQPDTSSYDYDAPLAENGDYTDKYYSVKNIIQKSSKIKFRTPEMPKLSGRIVYDQMIITEELNLNDILININPIKNERLIPMENLPINNNSGQKYGYITYRIENLDILPNSTLRIQGHVCDTIMVLINGKLVSKIPVSIKDISEFGFWRKSNPSLNLGDLQYKNATLDLIVENMGRVNYGKLDQFNQFKGLWQGQAYLNNIQLKNWLIYPLEFKTGWINALDGWKKADFNETGPKLYKGVLNINSDPLDTYIDMRDWIKGIVIVNGFVLSRYFKLGPQKACYLPAPLLKKGGNDVLIFEHFKGGNSVKFSKEQIYERSDY
ncbi:beta-galactosidase related [Holotrichia oblita]|uniref:Beta-galactosidase related n=1 Tax=Holotrichia oblita TaxID=644536 RepID=A0ACB9SWF4_HOLOL|nr:beta-galactosidase related [Holotrichia oblita]